MLWVSVVSCVCVQKKNTTFHHGTKLNKQPLRLFIGRFDDIMKTIFFNERKMKFRRSERKKERNDHNQWKERKGHMERIDKIVEKCCSYKIYTNLVYAVHANKSIQSECFVVAIGVLFICASEPMFIHIDVSKTDSPNVFLAFYFLFTRLFWRCCCCNFRNFQPPKLKNAIRVSITNIPLAVCTC